MRNLVIITFFLFSPYLLKAQQTEHTGWLALINSTKFNSKWGMLLDVQLRSADDMEYVRNFMFRPGLNYHLNKKTNVALGYMLNNTYRRLGPGVDNLLSEHRIWEQLLYNMPIKSTTLIHRFRVEQRFIEQPTADVFTQRLRYMLRGVIPLTPQDSTFKKGLFAGLQNEVFFNLQNKSKLNGNVFDQNRAYLALGYRLNPKIDVEAGYLNQFIKGKLANTTNNAFQLALYTRF